MRISYNVPFERPVMMPDHWVVPFMDGKCKVLEDDGFAIALLIEFVGQPLEYAPSFEPCNDGVSAFEIKSRDIKMPFVVAYLRDSIAFIQCYFSVGLSLDDIEAKYIGETAEEETLIRIKSLSMGRTHADTPLTFDFFTRAFMAAEREQGPRFDATLLTSARRARIERQYIDSFRYAFLLIEARYGEGQFKTASLKAVLKSNAIFKEVVLEAISGQVYSSVSNRSDTFELLEGSPTYEGVIDHLVEKRGFYFHSNSKRKDSWRPEDQGEAEVLADLAVHIAMGIAVKSAIPLFSEDFSKRHFEDAKACGAIIVYEVIYKYREPGESFLRDFQLNVSYPGTKVTSSAVMEVMKIFIEHFESTLPVAALKVAECRVQGTGEEVFEIRVGAKK
ncbi:hypothetical protein [Pseudomonas proteolytica]|uniref:hypothetical protein n=1 Tax=Pseudomonas proteolytica TaxID=219574 RepID=UPI0014751287|nr:hypothetical protein [Pseudomonas proteolytica]NMZ33969.1 hypothetical protein [Pseudomonas proteolytica]